MNRIITDEVVNAIKKILDTLPEHKDDVAPVEPKPYTPEVNYIQAVSPNYCLLGDPDYRTKMDFIAEYGNSFRCFAYCHYGNDFKVTPSPNWIKGDYGTVSGDYLNHIQIFIDEANKRGLKPIFSLFDDCGGSGTENIRKADRGKLQTYITAIVNALRGKNLVFETINEQPDRDFNGWVNHCIKILAKYPEAKVTTFENQNLSDYSTHHLYRPSFLSRNIIHSNDRPNTIAASHGGWTDEQYIALAQNCKAKGGHYEILMRWGRKPEGKLDTIDAIKGQWGNILEGIKSLK